LSWGDKTPNEETSKEILEPTGRVKMSKTLVALTAALVVVSLASLGLDRAQAGGATSAASRYSHQAQASTASQFSALSHRVAEHFAITEFSSSSAKSSAPKR